MFYDNFTKEQICGLFTPWHIVAIAVFVALAILTIFLNKKINLKQAKIILLIIAILVTVMEVIKMALRIYKGSGGDSWIPLYFCSLFIYAIWLTFINNKFFQNMGYSFMVFGGIFASITFTLYPSTSLMIFPIWHPGSLHSLIYHFLMFYSGVLVLQKQMYKPEWKHFFNYLAFTGTCCVVAFVINACCKTNMMFLSNPLGLPVLSSIANFSQALYAILAMLGQCVALFWFCYGFYVLCKIIRKKIEIKNNKQKSI